MARIEVDVAIIGAGTAGLTARRAAERAGARVIMMDPGPFGTTCARVGCMPSKLLIAAGDIAHDVRRASAFGVHAAEPRIDGREVMERVRRERDRFVSFVVSDVDELAPGRLLRTRARFTGPTTLAAGDDEVHARAVVIAVGSTPRVPPELASAGPALLTSDEVFELPQLPRSLAVVGAGVIGLELGQAFHRLGVPTAIFGSHGRCAGLSDPVVSRAAIDIFSAELDLRLGAAVEGARPDEGGVVLSIVQGGARREERFERVLVATGRVPRLGGLGLEHTGLALDAQGVPVHDRRTLQCGTSPVFIAGDANMDRPLLHEAAEDGRVAGDNAARWPDVLAHARQPGLAVVFSDPNVAVVGPGWRALAAAAAGGDVAYGEVRYEDQGRARVMLRNAGCVRVYADPCGVLLGAEMVAPAAEHTAHLLAWAVAQRLTVEAALAMPYYHPVIEEGIRTALRDLAARLKLAPRPAPLDCGPGT